MSASTFPSPIGPHDLDEARATVTAARAAGMTEAADELQCAIEAFEASRALYHAAVALLELESMGAIDTTRRP